jgi:PAS domain S-box-containing protein/putative nucleotidyltransferase with HDIG domain
VSKSGAGQVIDASSGSAALKGSTAEVPTKLRHARAKRQPPRREALADTRRRVAEEQLSESEARFRRLAENSPALIYRYCLDPPGFDYVSPAATAMTGYTPEEHYADPQLGFKLVHPDDRHLLEEASDPSAAASTLTLRWVRKDGRTIWTEQHNTLVLGDDGVPLAIEGVALDVTTIKQAELESMESTARLEKMVLDITQVMGLIVESRDPYTQGHQERVSILSALIAREMGLSEADVKTIELAALMHDVGKLSVPAEILNKPGALSQVEFDLIKNHSLRGYEILSGIDFGAPIAAIVRQHHERLDGSGYPDGLVGGEILLEARIICIADTVEAVASHRPYRPALGLDHALAEISEESGRYDPVVVRACLALAERGELAFLKAPKPQLSSL